MKINWQQSIFLILISICSSCNPDFLNPDDPSSINSSDVWADPSLIEMYVNQLYNSIPGYEYSNTLDNITDEGRCNYPGDVPNQILIGQWDQVSNPIGFWAYTDIRKTNEFFDNIPNADIPDDSKLLLTGQVRFIRALLYFKMVMRYGGIPIIDKAQGLDDDLEVSRNSLDECFEFIISELDQAVTELPDEAARGRVSKGAAMALKGRVLLFYASPLYNESQDAGRWQRAAEANMDVINLNKYDLYPDLSDLWLYMGNDHKESIFEIQYHIPEKQHSWDAGLRPLRLANNNAGQLSPLQELINAFPMKNGKDRLDPDSQYDEQQPYEGRDDRFYAYIAYNGSTVYGTNSGPPVREVTLEIYRGGVDYDADPSAIIYNTSTGYYTRKATNPTNTVYAGSTGSDQPWIELRYAEVLLNYAEAQNEALAAPDQGVYDALNKIRGRAGITNELVVGSLTKESMRQLIRNERYVELCFEKKRYWDIRRWKLAGSLLNGKKYSGVVINKQGDGTFTYQYEEIDPQPNVFTERMYWMPIPQEEISKNRNLTQNPGWN